MVSLWWVGGFLWWGDGLFCGVEKHANFFDFIFGWSG
jgi:hypothetical protein